MVRGEPLLRRHVIEALSERLIAVCDRHRKSYAAMIVAYQRAVAHRDRQGVEVDVLGAICDRLGELVYEMLTFADRTEDTIHLANLRLASTHLARYEREYLELARAADHPVARAGR